MVKDMYNRLTAIPNRPLLYDVYQYMWDAKETTSLLDSYISWLGRCSIYVCYIHCRVSWVLVPFYPRQRFFSFQKVVVVYLLIHGIIMYINVNFMDDSKAKLRRNVGLCKHHV